MQLRISNLRPTLAGSALLALMLLLTACGPLLPPPVPADPRPTPAQEVRPLNGHESGIARSEDEIERQRRQEAGTVLPPPEPADPRPTPTREVRPLNGPELIIAGSEDEIERRRRQWLQGAGTVLAQDGAGYFMDVQTARLRQKLAGTGVAVERIENTTTITFPGNTSFETNSARLDPAMEPVLGAIARVLNEYHQSLIVVTGHTDNLGDRDHNQRLSEDRALAVGQQLLAAGIPSGRMVLIGYGPDRPVTEVDTPEGRALNRRVELIVHPLVEP